MPYKEAIIDYQYINHKYYHRYDYKFRLDGIRNW